MTKSKAILVVLLVLGLMQQAWGTGMYNGKRYLLSLEYISLPSSYSCSDATSNMLIKAEFLTRSYMSVGVGIGSDNTYNKIFVEPGVTFNTRLIGNSVHATFGCSVYLGSENNHFYYYNSNGSQTWIVKQKFKAVVRPSLGIVFMLSKQIGLNFKLIFSKTNSDIGGFGIGTGLTIAI